MLEIWDLLLDWSYHKDFVDEPIALFLAFNALSNNLPLMVEGSTGSGKSRCLDLVFELIPEEWIMRVDSDTEAATIRIDFNGKKFLYISEYQKFAQHSGNLEMLKTIMEGKDYNASRSIGNKRVPFKVPKEIIPIMSVAYENAHDNRDAEFNRRVAAIHMRVDPDHVIATLRSNAQRRKFRAKYQTMPADRIEQLKNIVQKLINAKPETYPMSNPFHSFITDRYIAAGVMRGTATNSHIETYAKFAEGFAKLRLMSLPIMDQMKTSIMQKAGEIEKQEYLMILQDTVMNETVFGKDCYRNIMGVPYLGREILEMFDDKSLAQGNNRLSVDFGDMKGDVRLTIREICRGLDKRGYTIDEDYVRGAITDMETNFHITSDQGGNLITKQYMRVKREMPTIEFTREDWLECWKAGLQEALTDSEKKDVERWVKAQQDEKGHIVFDNPLTGEKEMLVRKKEVWK